MSFIADLRKAFWHAVIGVTWRLLVFGLSALCFSGLLSLRKWHSDYAPSEAWAKAVRDKGFEWSPVVGAAARTMLSEEITYSTPEIFYRALSSRINDKLELHPDDIARIKEYSQLRKKRERILKRFRPELAARDHSIESSSARLRKTIKSIATETASAKRKELDEKRKELRAELRELTLERTAIEAGLQKQLAPLDTRIKAAEEGMREAFDAAVPSARPSLQGFITSKINPEYAIRIGDESDPLHIFYVVTWYGLEGLLAFLLCAVIVPWLISLGGDTSDPKSVHSTVTGKIKGWLAGAFGSRAATGAAKILAAATVTGLAVAGVALATGDQPSIPPVILHEVDLGTATKGEKGEHGSPGEPGARGEQGKSGINGEQGSPGPGGENGNIPPELLDKLRQQDELIAELTRAIDNLTKNTERTNKNVEGLTQATRAISTNVNHLSTGMGSLTSNVANLGGSIDGLAFADSLLLHASDAANRRFFQDLNHIRNVTGQTTWDVQQVKSTVNQAAKDIPPVAGDLLQTTTIPDGTLARVNPFRRYKVTDAVVETVQRAMHDPKTPEEEKFAEELKTMKNEPQLRAWKFKKTLRKRASNPDTLRQFMSLIVKISRIQE